MKILVAAFAYNEIKYIPYMVEYYRGQGCDLLILDNYSTDGTYEWLVENGVDVERVNTNDAFHLPMLQQAMLKKLMKVCPNWVVYTGVDTYFYFEKTIAIEIANAERNWCNTISVDHIEARNTGEAFALPFQENYFFISKMSRKREMIVKYHPSFRFAADTTIVPRKKVWDSAGFLINYGMCKPKEERENTLQRRKRAWAMGEHINHGSHYREAKERQWIWDKRELTDIRTTRYNKMIK